MSRSIAFFGLMRRDIKLAFSQGGATGMVLAFFLVAVTLFPFGVGPDLAVLARISVGVIWVTALLSCLLSLDRLFQADAEDGSLDDLALTPLSWEMTVFAKSIAHWVATILPLIILAPILGGLLNMAGDGYYMLVLSLIIGTPALSFIGAIGAALTLAIRRGGVLLALLILPLYIPTLIFGVGAVEAAITGESVQAHLALLGAVSLVSILLGPLASAAALKMSLE